MNSRLLLGVLTWINGKYLEEKMFFSHLADEASKLDVDIYFFSPQNVKRTGITSGFYYSKNNGWKEKQYPQPDLIYDRFRNLSPGPFASFLSFRKQTKSPFLNSRLANKFTVHNYLNSHPIIQKWLPEAHIFRGAESILPLLNRYSSIYLKPTNGTGGKGILRLERDGNANFSVLGRNQQRNIIKKSFSAFSSLAPFVNKWASGFPYLAQQGLDLQWLPHHVTDFRLLVQKDGQGKWSITGLCGKIGGVRSATSNLHGGGKPTDPDTFFQPFFSVEKRQMLFAECHELGLLVSSFLEKRFGRLVELGIDLGIDRNGRIWLIEVNPKPGRDLFRQIGDLKTYHRAVQKPIEYAKYLYAK
jgi:hypothetical protein